jgi:hypothetical protein
MRNMPFAAFAHNEGPRWRFSLIAQIVLRWNAPPPAITPSQAGKLHRSR